MYYCANIFILSTVMQCQKVPPNITDMFMIDPTKLLAIKQGQFFVVINQKPYCYYNVGIQGCFAINCRKGCRCDDFLCSITEVYDKEITKM